MKLYNRQNLYIRIKIRIEVASGGMKIEKESERSFWGGAVGNVLYLDFGGGCVNIYNLQNCII